MFFRNIAKKPSSVEIPQKIIIDTHGGLQDILAIIFAHRYITHSGSGQQIIGITCVSGKNSLDKAVQSALVANKILGTKIPVYKGKSQNLIVHREYPKTYGDQKFTHLEQQLYSQVAHDKDIHHLIQKEKAVDFINRSCQQFKDKIGIVAFGPVTNLGLAHKLQGSLKYAKIISLTGGQYYGMGNTVKGNIQANFAADPLALFILLKKYDNGQHLKDKIYINPLQHTLSFCFKQAINECLDSGKLNKCFDEILVNMMGINSIVLNCGPILSVIPLLVPKTVPNVYHVYGGTAIDGDQLDGLFMINWMKAKDPQMYQNFMYIYENFDKPLVNKVFVQAFTQKAHGACI